MATDRTKYTLLMRILHWLIAVLILGMIGVGWYMAGLPDEHPTKYDIYAIHKSIGITLLGLVIIRLLVRFFSPIPKLPHDLAWWEKLLTKTVHFLLYALMLLVPISGYLMSDFAGFPVEWFGIEVPGLVDDDMDRSQGALAAHGILPYILLGLIGLHLLGSLKHRFFDKNKDNDVLKRML
ncbi:cytochrome b [Kangiella marina]|uniref:Cytochrome b n=1 Tax=Kangiella marina TaxID=1079178 RepID=A0ABP8ILN4_9GAMM